MFYKIINETSIEKAPTPLEIGGKNIFTNDEEIYNSQGYFALISTDYPNDKKNYTAKYILKDNKILQVWEEIVIPYEQRVVNRIRAKYSIDDELAILRQRDTKPEEFEQYNAFVEQIKAEERTSLENVG